MLEIGWSELLLLAVVAIVVVGPKELPAMMRAFGKTIGGLKRTANEFRAQFDEAVRQSELDSLRAEVESVRRLDPAAAIRTAIEKPDVSETTSANEPVMTSRAALSQRESPSQTPSGASDESKRPQGPEAPDEPEKAR